MPLKKGLKKSIAEMPPELIRDDVRRNPPGGPRKKGHE